MEARQKSARHLEHFLLLHEDSAFTKVVVRAVKETHSFDRVASDLVISADALIFLVFTNHTEGDVGGTVSLPELELVDNVNYRIRSRHGV